MYGMVQGRIMGTQSDYGHRFGWLRREHSPTSYNEMQAREGLTITDVWLMVEWTADGQIGREVARIPRVFRQRWRR